MDLAKARAQLNIIISQGPQANSICAQIMHILYGAAPSRGSESSTKTYRAISHYYYCCCCDLQQIVVLGHWYFTKELFSEIFSRPLRAKINCDAKERQVRAPFAQILNKALCALVATVVGVHPPFFIRPRSDHSLRMSATD